MKKKIFLSLIIMFFSFFMVSWDVFGEECYEFYKEAGEYNYNDKKIKLFDGVITGQKVKLCKTKLTITAGNYYDAAGNSYQEYIGSVDFTCNGEMVSTADGFGHNSDKLLSLEKEKRKNFTELVVSSVPKKTDCNGDYVVTFRTLACVKSCLGGFHHFKYKLYYEKEETPKEETPKEETPKEETPKEETPKEETPKEETPKEETPKEETPKEETPKEETPKEETPKEETPKEEKPKEETSSGKLPTIEEAPKEEPKEEEKKPTESDSPYESDGKDVSCEDWKKVRYDLRYLFNFMKILIPLLIMGLSIYDFIRATTSKDEKELKKAFKSLLIRFILAVVFFFLPTLIEVLLNLFEVNAEICIFKLF